MPLVFYKLWPPMTRWVLHFLQTIIFINITRLWKMRVLHTFNLQTIIFNHQWQQECNIFIFLWNIILIRSEIPIPFFIANLKSLCEYESNNFYCFCKKVFYMIVRSTIFICQGYYIITPIFVFSYYIIYDI